eukprot:403359320
MSGVSMTERYTTSTSDTDEVIGEYPFILYKDMFIARNNINQFFKMVSHINSQANLSQEERNTVEYFETLIKNKLSIVTRYNYEQQAYDQTKNQYASYLRQFLEGPLSFLNHHYLKRYLNEYHNNLDNQLHRFETAREVHLKLSRQLGARINFFSDRPLLELNDIFEEKITFDRISSLDLLVYAYLKEELNNTPNSKETQYLIANFRNLIKFVERIDLFISQNINEPLEKKEIYLKFDNSEDTLAKLHQQFSQDYELMASDRIISVEKVKPDPELEAMSAEDRLKEIKRRQMIQRIKKFALLGGVSGLFTYLNFAERFKE